MEIRSAWVISIERKIDEQVENLYKRDVKFFHVDTMLKIADKVDRFSETDSNCQIHKETIEELVENLPEYLNNSISKRREYEQKLTKIQDYLTKEHGIRLPRYFLSLYSLIGTALGVFLGVGVMYFINTNSLQFGAFGGFIIGLIVGRVMGNQKEKELEVAGKHL